MKVKLKKNVDSKYLDAELTYTVHAIFFDEPLNFMIYTDALPSAPFSVSNDDVDIVDSRVSKYWILDKDILLGKNSDNFQSFVLAFREWAEDPFFFENIVNGRSNAGEIWRKYVSLFELEYSSNFINKTARILQNEWLQCIQCGEVWVPDRINEIVQCPSCGVLQNRPIDNGE